MKCHKWNCGVYHGAMAHSCDCGYNAQFPPRRPYLNSIDLLVQKTQTPNLAAICARKRNHNTK